MISSFYRFFCKLTVQNPQRLTMQTFLKFDLYLHIFAGFTALTTGLVPMLAKKGSKTHTTWGKIYFWAMFVVALTALIRFRMDLRLIFLSGIAVFSFYNTFTGVRLIHRKSNPKPFLIDWFGAILMIIGSLGMLYFAYLAHQNDNVFYTILFAIFGMFMLCTKVRFLLKLKYGSVLSIPIN